MAVYKFRIIYEDHEDVSRDIEIKPFHSFEDLHLAIQDSIKFDASKAASFYISDDYFQYLLQKRALVYYPTRTLFNDIFLSFYL